MTTSSKSLKRKASKGQKKKRVSKSASPKIGKRAKKIATPIPQTAQAALQQAGPRPAETASREPKKNYAERVSNEMARFVAFRLRELGALDTVPGVDGGSERTFAGGSGDKQVDVSVATPEHGLILSIGLKSINFADAKSKNYAKNLTNRRGDMLAEATTLHQRFPYAVIGGLFLFHKGATEDHTTGRQSTFETAHAIFRHFGHRVNRSDGPELYEALCLASYDGDAPYEIHYYMAGEPTAVEIDEFLKQLLMLVAERNSDRFRFIEGKLVSTRTRAGRRTITQDPDEALADEIDPDPGVDEGDFV